MLAIAMGVGSTICHAGIVNGGFSQPNIGPAKIQFFDPGRVTGWATTDSKIEIWSDGAAAAGKTFNAPPGYAQFAEINANTAGTLSQTVSNIGVGHKLGFSFYHRGRESATKPDVVKVTVTDTVTKRVLLNQDFRTTNVKWQHYFVDLGIKKDSNPLLLSFKAVSSASTDLSIGNFLTGIELGETFMPLATFSDWQVQPVPASFTPLPQGYVPGRINNAVAFKAARIPAESNAWAKLNLDPAGMIQFDKPSRFADCNAKLDFTYFRTFVTISDVSLVKEIRVHVGAVDDYARVYVNNKFDERNDVKPPAKEGDLVLPAGYLTNGRNMIAIALLDDCRAHNMLKDTKIEIVPKP